MPAVCFASDVVVLTSDNEGTPVSLIEAQAAGVPVVATRVGGAAAVVDPRTGLLVDRDDVAGFARAVRDAARRAAPTRRSARARRRDVLAGPARRRRRRALPPAARGVMTRSPGRSTAARGVHTLLSRLVIYISAFAASVLVARGLGPSGNGLYTVAMTIGTIAALVGSLGFEQAQAKAWSRGVAHARRAVRRRAARRDPRRRRLRAARASRCGRPGATASSRATAWARRSSSSPRSCRCGCCSRCCAGC